MTAPAITRTPLVAVYGTLKRGLRNHHWLDDADFLGSDRLADVTLYDLGPFPGAKLEPSRGVEIDTPAADGYAVLMSDGHLSRWCEKTGGVASPS